MDISILLPFVVNYSATSAPIYGMAWQLIVKLLRHTGRRTRSAYLLFCYKNTANSQNLAKTRFKIWFRKNHYQDIKIAYPGAYQKTFIIFWKFVINPNKNLIIKILFYGFIFAMMGGVQKNSHYLAGNLIFHALYFQDTFFNARNTLSTIPIISSPYVDTRSQNNSSCSTDISIP